MYYGIPAFLMVFHKTDEAFKMLAIFHVATMILVSPSSTNGMIDYAGDLLNNFVRNFARVFEPKKVSHNIHGLTHIVGDVRNYGPLGSFSAFPFKNAMKTIRELLRSSNKLMQQLSNRRQEIINGFGVSVKPKKGVKGGSEFTGKYNNGPVVIGCIYPSF